MADERKARFREIRRTILTVLIGTSSLAILQAVAGILAGSYALLATSVQIGLDLIIGVTILYASAVAEKSPDETHPYGYGKAESIAAMLIGVLLSYAAYEIISGAIRTLLEPEVTPPGIFALIVAAIGVVVMEIHYRIQRSAGERLNSEPLIASAQDLRADELAVVASLIGVGMARLGYPKLDPAAALVVGVFILRAAYGVGYDSIWGLMDRPASREIERRIRAVAESVPGVLEAFGIRTRRSGPFVLADLAIHVDENITVKQAHQTALEVRRNVLEQVQGVVDVLVTIHVGRHEIMPRGDLAA